MDQNNDDVLATQNVAGPSSPVSPAIILWSVAALVLSIVFIMVNTSPVVLGASFIAKAFAALVGTVLGTVGALLGNAIRKFAQPDAVFTRGGIGSLIWLKVFWSVGPQCIGLLGGILLGISMVLAL